MKKKNKKIKKKTIHNINIFTKKFNNIISKKYNKKKNSYRTEKLVSPNNADNFLINKSSSLKRSHNEDMID